MKTNITTSVDTKLKEAVEKVLKKKELTYAQIVSEAFQKVVDEDE